MSAAERSLSWRATSELERSRVERLLKQSPGLRPGASNALPEIYAEAILRAIKETGLERKAFPSGCPSTEEILVTKDVAVSY